MRPEVGLPFGFGTPVPREARELLELTVSDATNVASAGGSATDSSSAGRSSSGMMKIRPHRIDGEDLWIHRGVWGYLRIPVANVAGVRAVSGSPDRRIGEAGAVAFTVKGAEKVELTFRTPVVPMGFLTASRQTQRMVVSADDPAAFCAAVARAANL